MRLELLTKAIFGRNSTAATKLRKHTSRSSHLTLINRVPEGLGHFSVRVVFLCVTILPVGRLLGTRQMGSEGFTRILHFHPCQGTPCTSENT